MARYTPEFLAHLRHRYEETNDTLAAIALDCRISERTLNRMRDREGWNRRSDREPHGMTPAMRLLEEATGLLAAQGAVEESRVGTAPAAPLPTLPAPSAAERIARLVEKEIAAEEAMRAHLGALPRTPADAERAARTLATLTQTLHALARLRCGETPDIGGDDDDMPRDIDEFRRDLARRIDAFVASRTEPGDAPGHSEPAAVD